MLSYLLTLYKILVVYVDFYVYCVSADNIETKILQNLKIDTKCMKVNAQLLPDPQEWQLLHIQAPDTTPVAFWETSVRDQTLRTAMLGTSTSSVPPARMCRPVAPPQRRWQTAPHPGASTQQLPG
jgi:hypothetical protein